MKKYCIYTDSGKYYYIIEKGGKSCIIQADRYRKHGENAISEQWHLKGFSEILPFNNLGSVKSIEALSKEATDKYGYCKFKNGRGKYALIDYDHGTTRIWGDRINSVWETER